MKTVIIMDRDDAGVLSVTLSALLRVVAPDLEDTEWTVSRTEAVGAGAEALYEKEARGERLTTAALGQLAEGLDQVIEGVFVARGRGSREPRLVLRAVDGSSWDVSTNDARILERVRQSFARIYEVGDVG